LVVVLAIFLALGVMYSLTVPVFEAPDELYHYFYVRHLASGNPLPVQDPAVEQPWAQEGSQPPLYYALAGLATAWIPTDDALLVSRPNWHANIGVPMEPGNKNRIVHSFAAEWPYQGTKLAVHVARWLSLLLGMGTIVCTYFTARRLIPDQPAIALAAAAVNAFIPQFIFISAAVSNDNLIIFLGAFTLWQLVRLLQEPHTTRRLLLLGVTLGLAALAKLSGIALIPLAVGVLILQAWRQHRWRTLWRDLLLISLPILVVAGWWYWRNWQLYGDPTGLNVMLQMVGPRNPPPNLAQLSSEFQGLRISFWGLFGWFNVPFPHWVYVLLDWLSALTVVGLLIGVFRLVYRAGQRAGGGAGLNLRAIEPLYWTLLLLSAWVAIITTALVRWTRLTPGTQGRLIFPAISALAILLVLSWSQLLPVNGRVKRAWLAVWPAVLLVLALAVPIAVIPLAYAPPPKLAATAVPVTARLAQPIRFGQVAQLIGAEVSPDIAQPGGEVQVTLYWEALASMSYDLSLYIRLLGRGNEVIGQIDSYPGWGSYATSLWQPGDIFADTYRLPISWNAQAPAIVRVDTGLYYAPTQQDVPSLDAQGRPLPAIVDTLRLTPGTAAPEAAQHQADFDFNGLITLRGYNYSPATLNAGDAITVTLHWQAVATMGDDLTVFVHLLNANGDKVTQVDHPPLDGDYPTSAWQPSDMIVDHYVLTIPPDATAGAYRPLVGFYLPETQERVQVGSNSGEVRDRGALLAPLTVK
jgi:4-amino-4-deoxy-L-arabinose transferase-like glycosyltransferase